MKNYIIYIGLILGFSTFGQFGKEISYGFTAGGVYSKTTNLPDMIVPPGIYSNYSLATKDNIGFTVGGFLNIKYPDAMMSIQPEIYYSKQGSELNYSDIKGLEYKLKFDYNYLNVGLLLKFYPTEGLYLGVGPYLGLNLTRDDIVYKSNGAELNVKNNLPLYESDVNVQKVLRDSFEGNDFFFVKFETGYEFNKYLKIGFAYNLGVSDVLKTQENGFRYIENINKTSSYMFSIGYKFDFNESTNF